MYIKKEDYLYFSGVDLDIEFKSGNYDIEDSVNMFLKKVESRTINFLKNHYDNLNFENKINANLERFKEGLLWQVDFTLANGELFNNADRNVNLITISPDAFNIFQSIGLCNVIRG